MLQDNKTSKTGAAVDTDDLAAQIAALREDLAKLAQSIASTTAGRGRKLASDISDGMSEAVHYVERRSTAAEADLERTVAAHPLLAIGLAAGAGLLVGALARR